MKGSLIILSFFVVGILAGFYDLLPLFLTEQDYSMYILYVLMFLVGFGIGGDESAWNVIKKANIKIFLIPLATVLGSLLGAFVLSFLLGDYPIKDLMACASGYGYYSLSSIFISSARGELLGTVALLSNIMREVITLLGAPLFMKLLGPYAPIIAGGATSMDTTLPIISQSSGKDYGVISLFHGVVLTLLVPFIVPFILSL